VTTIAHTTRNCHRYFAALLLYCPKTAVFRVSMPVVFLQYCPVCIRAGKSP